MIDLFTTRISKEDKIKISDSKSKAIISRGVIGPIVFIMIPCLIALIVTDASYGSILGVLFIIGSIGAVLFYGKSQSQEWKSDAGRLMIISMVFIITPCSFALFVNDTIFSFILLSLFCIVSALMFFKKMPGLIKIIPKNSEKFLSKRPAKNKFSLPKIINRVFQLISSFMIFFVIPFCIAALIDSNKYMVLLLFIVGTISSIFCYKKSIKQTGYKHNDPDILPSKPIKLFSQEPKKRYHIL